MPPRAETLRTRQPCLIEMPDREQTVQAEAVARIQENDAKSPPSDPTNKLQVLTA